MNYLAHIYLSGNHDDLKIGNFIADFIKPKDVHQLPFNQQKGVELHQKIDRFTDTHLEVRKVRELFFDEFRHYSAVLVDVIFDHYLARNWNFYHSVELPEYAQLFYSLLENQKNQLPNQVQQIIPYLIDGDWLSNYAHLQGLEMILKQMNNRTKNTTSLHVSISTLKTHDSFIAQQFQVFFAELIAYCNQEIQQMNLNQVN